jgi:hypothetical protein
MMSLYRKKYILTFGFIFYFFIYAISPLSHSLSAKNFINKFAAQDSAPGFSTSANIYVWDLICSRLVFGNTASSDSTDRILFRKARAILPSDTNFKIAHLENASVADSFFIPFDHSLSRLAGTLDRRSPLQDYRPLYSGLSPPAV